MMERGDDAGRAGLRGVFEADRIVRSEPTPSLKHASLPRRLPSASRRFAESAPTPSSSPLATPLGSSPRAFTQLEFNGIVHPVPWGRRVLRLRETGEGKSKPWGRKIQARGRKIQGLSFRESSLFKELRQSPT